MSQESLDGCHYNAGRDMVTLYCINNPETQLFTGKSLALGGKGVISAHPEPVEGRMVEGRVVRLRIVHEIAIEGGVGIGHRITSLSGKEPVGDQPTARPTGRPSYARKAKRPGWAAPGKITSPARSF